MKIIFFFLIVAIPLGCYTQTADSLQIRDTISQIMIRGYHYPNKMMNTTSSVSIVDSNILTLANRGSFLEPLNTVPGLRMEERSPGSYRLSIRGSLLRSPYGIRNIKIYLDDFSLTDASGNTYLNLLDPKLIDNIEIYKGPHSSQFGVNTGGTVLLHTNSEKELEVEIESGNYAYFHPYGSFSDNFGAHKLNFFTSMHKNEGYREQSAMDRFFIFLKDDWKINEKLQLHGLFFYSDLHYETPGGLTFGQMIENRRQARLPTNFTAGAVEQEAGIFNNTFFGGLSARLRITSTFRNTTAINATSTDFENPFITNYEKRFERELAVRSQFTNEIFSKDDSFLQINYGFEGAKRQSELRNFENNFGETGDPQNFDNLKTESKFAFASLTAEWNKLFLETGLSLNFLNYDLMALLPVEREEQKKFRSEFMPKFGLSYEITPSIVVRGNLSKGFSPPTLEEIRPSTQQFYENLEAESGWNKEIGLRVNELFKAMTADINFFNFHLEDAIIRQENNQGQEFFVNSGGTKQTGIEAFISSRHFPFENSFLKSLQFGSGATFYNFEFADFTGNEAELNGNMLTGVPNNSLQFTGRFCFSKQIQLTYNHYYSSDLPLNDQNTVYAENYHNANSKLSVPIKFGSKNMQQLTCSIAVNNLLNDKYSFGNDINAFGQRYYNPAPERNYALGVNWKIN